MSDEQLDRFGVYVAVAGFASYHYLAGLLALLFALMMGLWGPPKAGA